MRQKELRLALVCYGGVSLAVYMHGITKEIWHLARASRVFHQAASTPVDGVAEAYLAFLAEIERVDGLRLRILPDVLTGASAGGINAVFLAQAIHAGHSLEPLTDLWLGNADVSELTDPDAEPMWRYAKLWAQPIAEWFLRRPGNAVSATVSPETRAEVRQKVSRFVRGRWFSPPFSGSRFSAMLFEALTKMEAEGDGISLLPPGYPVDLIVTATDFRGHPQTLRLNSPPQVEEMEHRLPIWFRARVNADPAQPLADRLELVLAARATASFPGAFPPLKLAEIDALAAAEGHEWATRSSFLERIMPVQMREGTIEEAALIDGADLWRAFVWVALPLARPGIVVSAILSFIFSWNNFVFGVVLAGRETRTLPVAVYNSLSFEQLSWGPLAAAALVVTLPVLILTVIIQKQIVGGLAAGAVKGG